MLHRYYHNENLWDLRSLGYHYPLPTPSLRSPLTNTYSITLVILLELSSNGDYWENPQIILRYFMPLCPCLYVCECVCLYRIQLIDIFPHFHV